MGSLSSPFFSVNLFSTSFFRLISPRGQLGMVKWDVGPKFRGRGSKEKNMLIGMEKPTKPHYFCLFGIVLFCLFLNDLFI
jgi:hypothetical protein